jgi:hypothetical protein
VRSREARVLAIALAPLGCAAPAADYAGEEVACEWVMSPQYVGFGTVRIRPERRCRAVPVRSAEPPPMPGDVRPPASPGAPKIEVESEERK